MEHVINFNKPVIENQLFIVGAEKAGTTLLLALLDNHPQVFAFPFELKFHALFNFVSQGNNFCDLAVLNNYFLKESKFALLIDGKTDDHISRYSTGKLNFETINSARLKDYLANIQNAGFLRNEYFLELAYSLLYAQGEKRNQIKHLIEKPGNHALDYIEQIFHDFPASRIIHVIRDPKDNLAASKLAITKYNGIWGDYIPAYTLKGIKKGFDIARYYYRNKQYRVVKFEDLIMQTDYVMRSIAKWLNIPYKACMLEPTILGIPWGGNSSSDEKFSTVSKKPIGRAKGVLSRTEIQLTEVLLRGQSEFFGYPSNTSGISKSKEVYLKTLQCFLWPQIVLIRRVVQKICRVKRYPYYLRVVLRKFATLRGR